MALPSLGHLLAMTSPENISLRVPCVRQEKSQKTLQATSDAAPGCLRLRKHLEEPLQRPLL